MTGINNLPPPSIHSRRTATSRASTSASRAETIAPPPLPSGTAGLNDRIKQSDPLSTQSQQAIERQISQGDLTSNEQLPDLLLDELLDSDISSNDIQNFKTLLIHLESLPPPKSRALLQRLSDNLESINQSKGAGDLKGLLKAFDGKFGSNEINNQAQQIANQIEAVEVLFPQDKDSKETDTNMTVPEPTIEDSLENLEESIILMRKTTDVADALSRANFSRGTVLHLFRVDTDGEDVHYRDYETRLESLDAKKQQIVDLMAELNQILETHPLDAEQQELVRGFLNDLGEALHEANQTSALIHKHAITPLKIKANKQVAEARKIFDNQDNRFHQSEKHIQALEQHLGELTPENVKEHLRLRGANPEVIEQLFNSINSDNKQLLASLALLSTQGIESLNQHADYAEHFLKTYEQVIDGLHSTQQHTRAEHVGSQLESSLVHFLEEGKPFEVERLPSKIKELFIPDEAQFISIQMEIQQRKNEQPLLLLQALHHTLEKQGVKTIDLGNDREGQPITLDLTDLENLPLEIYRIAQENNLTFDEMIANLYDYQRFGPKVNEGTWRVPFSTRSYHERVDEEGLNALLERGIIDLGAQIQTDLIKALDGLISTDPASPADTNLEKEIPDKIKRGIEVARAGGSDIQLLKGTTLAFFSLMDKEGQDKPHALEASAKSMKFRNLAAHGTAHKAGKDLIENFNKLREMGKVFEAKGAVETAEASAEQVEAVLGIAESYQTLLKALDKLTPEQQSRYFKNHPTIRDHIRMISDVTKFDEIESKNPDANIQFKDYSDKDMARIKKWSKWINTASDIKDVAGLPGKIKAMGTHLDHIMMLANGVEVAEISNDRRHIKIDTTFDAKGRNYELKDKIFEIDGVQYKVEAEEDGVLTLDKPLPKTLKAGTQLEIGFQDRADQVHTYIKAGLGTAKEALETVDAGIKAGKFAKAGAQLGARGTAYALEKFVVLLTELNPELASNSAVLNKIKNDLKPLFEFLAEKGLLTKMEELAEDLGKIMKNLGGGEDVAKATKTINEAGHAERGLLKLQAKLPKLGQAMAVAFILYDLSQYYDIMTDDKYKGDIGLRNKKMFDNTIALIGDISSLFPKSAVAQEISLYTLAYQAGTFGGEALYDSPVGAWLNDKAGFGVDFAYGNLASNQGSERLYNIALSNGVISKTEHFIRSAVDGRSADQYDDDDRLGTLGHMLKIKIRQEQERGLLSESEAMLLRHSAQVDENGKIDSNFDSRANRTAIIQQIYSDESMGNLEEVEKLLLLKGLGKGDPSQVPSDSQINQALEKLRSKIDNESNPVKKALLSETLHKAEFWIMQGPPGHGTTQVDYD